MGDLARGYIEALEFTKPVKASVPTPLYAFHVAGGKAAVYFFELQTCVLAGATVDIGESLHLQSATSKQQL